MKKLLLFFILLFCSILTFSGGLKYSRETIKNNYYEVVGNLEIPSSYSSNDKNYSFPFYGYEFFNNEGSIKIGITSTEKGFIPSFCIRGLRVFNLKKYRKYGSFYFSNDIIKNIYPEDNLKIHSKIYQDNNKYFIVLSIYKNKNEIGNLKIRLEDVWGENASKNGCKISRELSIYSPYNYPTYLQNESYFFEAKWKMAYIRDIKESFVKWIDENSENISMKLDLEDISCKDVNPESDKFRAFSYSIENHSIDNASIYFLK